MRRGQVGWVRRPVAALMASMVLVVWDGFAWAMRCHWMMSAVPTAVPMVWVTMMGGTERAPSTGSEAQRYRIRR